MYVQEASRFSFSFGATSPSVTMPVIFKPSMVRYTISKFRWLHLHGTTCAKLPTVFESNCFSFELRYSSSDDTSLCGVFILHLCQPTTTSDNSWELRSTIVRAIFFEMVLVALITTVTFVQVRQCCRSNIYLWIFFFQPGSIYEGLNSIIHPGNVPRAGIGDAPAQSWTRIIWNIKSSQAIIIGHSKIQTWQLSMKTKFYQY